MGKMHNAASDYIPPPTPRVDRLEAALRIVLDAVDYTAGACRPNEMVGAVLDKRVIEIAKDALASD